MCAEGRRSVRFWSGEERKTDSLRVRLGVHGVVGVSLKVRVRVLVNYCLVRWVKVRVMGWV